MTEISKSNEPAAHNFAVTEEQTQEKHENTLEKVFSLVNEDYRHDTQFIISLSVDDKPPGTLTGEECPASDLASNSYEYLATQYPHWRRMLSDEYMRNTHLGDISKEIVNPAQLVLLHIDDHAWASIDHYMVASKFIHSPDVYKQFCLDSGDSKSRLTAAEVKKLGLTLPITDEANLDWENRKSDTLRRGLLAKFAQNQDLQRALVLTGWAKLVSQTGNVLELLMWVRAVLRGEQQQESGDSSSKQDKVDTDKNMDEVFRVLEGIFGKENKQLISSLIEATMKEKLSETKQEAKHLEVKDAVGYLEQVKSSYVNDPQVYNHFLDIMNEFRSEKINTSQVLERVTLLFRGKPFLIRNFLMFLPPGHVLDASPEDKPHLTYIATPSGARIIINIDEATVKFE